MDYRDEIIDHYKNPRNFGEMEDADVTINEANSSCGDVVQIQIKVRSKKNKGKSDVIIEKMVRKGIGCAISTAAASILSDKVVGMTVEEIKNIGEEGIVAMMGGEINAGRMKCATLAYRALLTLDKNE